MTKTANKFNSLAQIAFVEDIDQETAANYSGGAGVTLFQDINLGGSNANFGGVGVGSGIPYVGDTWNDRASGVTVSEGTWEFYTDSEYRGDKFVVPSGSYGWLGNFFNDKISSFRRVG
jgi:Beta/Gamma crystallin